mgnify:CR=1 FL=1
MIAARAGVHMVAHHIVGHMVVVGMVRHMVLVVWRIVQVCEWLDDKTTQTIRQGKRSNVNAKCKVSAARSPCCLK